MVHKRFVRLADRKGPNKKSRVVYYFQISLEIGAMADFVSETECLLILHNQGHELTLFAGRKKGI